MQWIPLIFLSNFIYYYMEEIWKDINGFEGKNQISNLGRVKSLNYRHTNKEVILKPFKCSSIGNQYYKVQLLDNQYYIHRLVAQTFIPNPSNLPQINHIDENHFNNSIDNLEWCTPNHNCNHGTRITRIASKLSKKVRCIELNKIYDSAKIAAVEFNIHRTSISNCCAGHCPTCRGYHWEYI